MHSTRNGASVTGAQHTETERRYWPCDRLDDLCREAGLGMAVWVDSWGPYEIAVDDYGVNSAGGVS